MNYRNLKHGLVSGLGGGVVFGVMMAMMGTLPMIGKMVGIPTATAGFVVHMLISGAIGISFALVFNWMVRGVPSGSAFGLFFGAAWWLLGPLTLMPLFMGMGLGVNWNLAAASQMLPSLLGHLLYGLALGALYVLLRLREDSKEASGSEPTVVSSAMPSGLGTGSADACTGVGELSLPAHGAGGARSGR